MDSQIKLSADLLERVGALYHDDILVITTQGYVKDAFKDHENVTIIRHDQLEQLDSNTKFYDRIMIVGSGFSWTTIQNIVKTMQPWCITCIYIYQLQCSEEKAKSWTTKTGEYYNMRYASHGRLNWEKNDNIIFVM